MPNHCTNILTVFGTEEMISSFINDVKTDEQPLSFTSHIAMPEEEKSNWHSWSMENWGSKWDAYDGQIERINECCVQYDFYTACNPAYQWFDVVATELSDYSFILDYEEPGCQLAGRLVVSEGLFDEENSFRVNSFMRLADQISDQYEDGMLPS